MKQDFFIDPIEDDLERANARAKLTKMVEYGSTKSCRREFLLNYFSEEWPQESCGACDICLEEERHTDPGSTFDGTEATQKVLSAVIRTGERFGANHIVEVLRGSRSRRVLALRHDELPVHGIARGMQTDDLKDIVDQLIDTGLVGRAAGEFPTLFVTSQGREFLKNREEITLVRRVNSPTPRVDSVIKHNAELFEKLRVLRKTLADALSVPAFVVFNDESLRQMASSLPMSPDSFRNIKGVGESKLQRFGDQFISVIAEHVAVLEGKTRRTPSHVGTALVSHNALPRRTAYTHAPAPTPVEKLLSRLIDPVTIPPGDPPSRRAWQSALGKVLATLHEREAYVLSSRFGLEDGRERTLQEIGVSLSISRERVRQIENKALRKTASSKSARAAEDSAGG